MLNRVEKKKKSRKSRGWTHALHGVPVFIRCTCAKTRVCVHAPNLSFRIHLARIIDHECTSDRAARGPSQKSSYLHSPCIVGFRIKPAALRRGRGLVAAPRRRVLSAAKRGAEHVAQIYWKCRARDYRGLSSYHRIQRDKGIYTEGKETNKV